MQLAKIYQCFCDENRLRILNLLASGPLCGCHFQDILKLSQVKISKHLAYLRERQMVECRREQNWMVYSLPKNPPPEMRYNLLCLEDCRGAEPVFAKDLARLHQLLPEMRVPASDSGEKLGGGSPFKILFLCTGNSARSIIAEFLLKEIGGPRFVSYSAGSLPRPEVNPLALRVLREVYRINPAAARSKSWTELGGTHFDFIITLCEKARESCPPWKGAPITAHWNFEDPAAFEGSESESFSVFTKTAALIEKRLREFVALPIEELDSLRMEHNARAIGMNCAGDSIGSSCCRPPRKEKRRSASSVKSA
jgi:protein-tyrosine-phosphatase/DNA-binding transcriptional ArsR family regulator